MRLQTRVGVITGLLASCAMCVYAASPKHPVGAPPSDNGVIGAPDAEALFHSSNPLYEKNKQAAYHIMKELLECHHWEMADKWIDERYLQHNPQASSGREAVIKFFTQVLKQQPKECPEKLTTKIVAVIADGDFVTVMTPREFDDPTAPGKKYSTTWFDTWRFVDGKADEHWDPATKPAPAK